MALKSVFSSSILKFSYINTNCVVRRNFNCTVLQNAKTFNTSKKVLNEEYKYINPQEEILTNTIKNFDRNKSVDWDNLKKYVLESGNHVKDFTFDASFIGLCIAQRNLEAGRSYVNYIYENNQLPNIATLGRYLQLQFMCNINKNLSESDEKEIFKIYLELKKLCPLFDSITCENVILGLSLTKEWKETLNLLEMLKLSCTPGVGTYSAIAMAAFINNDEDVGWKILNEAVSNDRSIYTYVYSAYFEMAMRNTKTAVAKIEELFNFLENNDIYLSKDTTDELVKLMKIFGYSAAYTSIGLRGNCPSCRHSLQEVSFKQEDFEQLKTVFMEKVIIGKNVFNKTSPEELEKFKNVISRAGKYDMVIDGLNVAYAAGNKLQPIAYAKMVSSVVQHFTRLNKRLLVLGRVHMQKWPREQMNYIRANADVFLTQNISQDDPFLLYATMSSGLGTGFLSRDFMRGHAYLLMDQNIRRIFRRWQQLHQHSLIYVENNGKVHIKNPYRSLPSVQKHKTGWHIPYELEFMVQPPLSLDPPTNWLCLHKNIKT